MAYQVLARKWRPQEFAALIGQGPIVTALRNALSDGRIAQAYLFAGIRGVGKTTAARLLAKALNCERGPAAEPCNNCPPCRDIAAGSDMDVIEVDAATYSKVEQVRELAESLRYGPARDRYKVVVLDEVHRLSRQAFDALLKIVEEPPAHLVFIFATTEIEAVPATILSRCQEYHFRRVPAGELAQHLRTICDAETIVASDAGLRLVARAGEGSVRDAVALLDQLATFGGGTIDDGEAARLVGGLDTALFQRLLRAILGGDAAVVAAAARQVEEEGWDPRHVFAHFLGYCRDALHLALGGDPSQVDLPREDAAALHELARGAGYENLLRLLHQLLASETTVRRSEVGALAVEIAWLRAAELPKLLRVEEILAGGSPTVAPAPRTAASPASSGGGGAGGRRAAPPAAESTARQPASDAARAAAAAPAPTAAPPATPGPTPPARAAAPADGDEAGGSTAALGADADPRLQLFLDALSRRKQPLAARFEDVERLALEDGELVVTTHPGDTWLRVTLERGNNRELIEQALAETFGAGTPLKLRDGAGARMAANRPSPVVLERVQADPTVQTVLEIFGGTVERVEPRGKEEA
jgi:DNA polymerase III subunit gamma/tau